MFTYKLANRKNEYGEWVIRCRKDGVRYPEGDYFTDDKGDAIATLADLEKRANIDRLADIAEEQIEDSLHSRPYVPSEICED